MTFKAQCFRAAGQYDAEKASREAGLVCDDPSLTLQSESNDADINTIVARFGLGDLPVARRIPLEVDLDVMPDYRSCMNEIVAADRAFMSQPAAVRARFENDPARFIAFFDSPDNYEEGVRLGVLTKRPEKVVEPAAPVA